MPHLFFPRSGSKKSGLLEGGKWAKNKKVLIINKLRKYSIVETSKGSTFP